MHDPPVTLTLLRNNTVVYSTALYFQLLFNNPRLMLLQLSPSQLQEMTYSVSFQLEKLTTQIFSPIRRDQSSMSLKIVSRVTRFKVSSHFSAGLLFHC